ncbi:MAG: poly(3-hydroxybutyrate) depolymerase, partial [Pseudomonadota bacterium]|nr:poly(3-hydroxybutyrate) depolymerase [Pseudomonadota bacterium]
MHNRYGLTCLLLFSLVINACAEVHRLPGYGVDLTQTSVSGLSSGGFMAMQLHVAYSDKIMGAGIIAGGPYYCAGAYQFNTFISNALTLCMNPIGAGPPSKKLFNKAQTFAKQGLIADLDDLKDDNIYLFSGTEDNTVKTKVVDKTYEFYKWAGVAETQIKYVKDVPAGHAIITHHEDDNPCSHTGKPFINDCDFFQSHRILKHLYGDALKPAAKQLSGNMITFDQSE